MSAELREIDLDAAFHKLKLAVARASEEREDLRARNARLRAVLTQTRDVLCSRACGALKHHTACAEASAVLAEEER